MPLPKSSKRETLESIGAKELWVEVRLMSGMPYSLARKFWDVGDTNDADEQYDRLKTLMETLVINWNIPEVDGGEPLPLPKDNRDIVDDLPLSIVNFISALMTEDSSLEEVENL